MLLPLESLKKVWRASSALEFRDLIGIAAYSVSPSTAYKVARRLDWGKDKASSCKYLAMILRDYGSKAFRKLVAKTNPEDYQDLCLCECHLGNWEFDMFLGNCNDNDDEWEQEYECNCCGRKECFHAAHTFNYDCEFCDNDGSDENEHVCDDCDNQPCDHCDCNGCAEQFTNCERNCNGYYGCQECQCNGCDENNATAEDEDEELKNSPNIPERAPRIPEQNAPQEIASEIRAKHLPTSTERLKEISERIARVLGERRAIKEVYDIEGDKVQAQAVHNDADHPIIVTNLLIDELSDDELAWVIAHENAHIEHKDGERTGTAIDESVERLKTGLRSIDEHLKEKGYGFIGRTFSQVIAGILGGASIYVNAKHISREHENEADERAIEIVQKAGYNPSASISAMRKISRRGSRHHNGIIEAITSTHPSPHERIENLEKKKKDDAR